MGRPSAAAGGRVGRPPAVPGTLPAHLSVSQVETLSDCGMKYRLQRLDGIQEVPAWWNIGGTAFHATIEWWERQYFATGTRPGTGQSLEYFREVFVAGIKVTQQGALSVPSAQWRAGGSGKEDGAWWAEQGPLMVTAYVAAHQGDGPRMVPIIGAPAIELPFELDANGIPVKGFIDQARYSYTPGDERPAFHLVDLKAGRNKPAGTFQLGVYGQALRRCYGVTGPITGRYWLARKGEYTQPIDLDKAWPWEAIVYRVHMADRIRQAGLYQPRESSFCGSCSVNSECPTRTGRWPTII